VELLASLIAFLAVFLLILRALYQSGLLKKVTPAPWSAKETAPDIAVIVPARDEAANIGRCLTSLLAQDYPADRLHLLAVDDESADATPAIVKQLAKRHANLLLLRGGPLTKGWTGKSQACWIGARAAPDQAEWLCFIDADMQAEPLLIASALGAAGDSGADLLSLAPKHRLGSFAERLMIPCGLYLQSFRQNLARLQAPDSEDASATGQFMLIRREAYERVGGHAAVAAAICEDVALARLFKRSGYGVELMDGTGVISTRMYTGWRTLWPGFAKNLSDMLGGPLPTLTTAICAIVLAWVVVVLPIVDWVGCGDGTHGACAALAFAVPALLAALGLHLAGTVYFSIPFWYGFLFPFGYTAGAFIALDSIRQRIVGAVRWKGRAYP
jgi:chlorobactene glucosyltransferase